MTKKIGKTLLTIIIIAIFSFQIVVLLGKNNESDAVEARMMAVLEGTYDWDWDDGSSGRKTGELGSFFNNQISQNVYCLDKRRSFSRGKYYVYANGGVGFYGEDRVGTFLYGDDNTHPYLYANGITIGVPDERVMNSEEYNKTLANLKLLFYMDYHYGKNMQQNRYYQILTQQIIWNKLDYNNYSSFVNKYMASDGREYDINVNDLLLRAQGELAVIEDVVKDTHRAINVATDLNGGSTYDGEKFGPVIIKYPNLNQELLRDQEFTLNINNNNVTRQNSGESIYLKNGLRTDGYKNTLTLKTKVFDYMGSYKLCSPIKEFEGLIICADQYATEDGIGYVVEKINNEQGRIISSTRCNFSGRGETSWWQTNRKNTNNSDNTKRHEVETRIDNMGQEHDMVCKECQYKCPICRNYFTGKAFCKSSTNDNFMTELKHDINGNYIVKGYYFCKDDKGVYGNQHSESCFRNRDDWNTTAGAVVVNDGNDIFHYGLKYNPGPGASFKYSVDSEDGTINFEAEKGIQDMIWLRSDRYEINLEKSIDFAILPVTMNKIDLNSNPIQNVKFSYEAIDRNGTVQPNLSGTITTDANGQGTIWITSEVVALNIKELSVPTGVQYEEDASATVEFGWNSDETKYVQKGLTGGLGVETTVDSNGITVKNNIETTDITVEKVWNPAGESHPSEIEIQLCRQVGENDIVTSMGNSYKVKLSDSTSWSHTFENLPKYKDGVEIIYSAQEAGVPEGWETASETNGSVITITNTKVNTQPPPGIKLVLHKKDEKGTNLKNVQFKYEIKYSEDTGNTEIWTYLTGEDGKTEINIPPKEGKSEAIIYITEIKTQTGYIKYDKPIEIKIKLNTEKTKWEIESTTLPSGVEINENGNATVEGKEYTIINIEATNTMETTELTVKKVWEDSTGTTQHPTSVTVQLYKKVGDTETEVGDPITLSQSNSWSYTFSSLPKYENGTLIEYRVEETKIPGYDVEYKKEENIITIKNKRITTEINVEKQWLNIAGNSITNANLSNRIKNTIIKVGLMKIVNGKEETTGKTLELTSANNWKGTFENLVKQNLDGTDINYTVKEVTEVTGYEPQKPIKKGNTFTIENKKISTEVTVTKKWENVPSGEKTPAITIILLGKDGDAVDKITFSEGTSTTQKHTFKNLEKYDEDGVEIPYRIQEVNVDGYTSSEPSGSKETGFTITNTYTPPPAKPGINLTLNKGDEDGDGLVGSKFTYTVTYNGNINGGSGTLDLTERKSKRLTLNPNVDINTVTIKLNESKAPDLYTLTSDDIIINLKYDETNKKWVKNGEPTKPINVSIDFPTSNSEYATNIGVTVKNEPDKTDITVNKKWLASDGKTELTTGIPDEVTIQLYKKVGDTETEVGDPITLSQSNLWTYTFRELPKAKKGEAITYKIKEVQVPGYTTRIVGDQTRGFTITNTKQETTLPNLEIDLIKKNQDNEAIGGLKFEYTIKEVDSSNKVIGDYTNYITTQTDNTNKGTAKINIVGANLKNNTKQIVISIKEISGPNGVKIDGNKVLTLIYNLEGENWIYDKNNSSGELGTISTNISEDGKTITVQNEQQKQEKVKIKVKKVWKKEENGVITDLEAGTIVPEIIITLKREGSTSTLARRTLPSGKIETVTTECDLGEYDRYNLSKDPIEAYKYKIEESSLAGYETIITPTSTIENGTTVYTYTITNIAKQEYIKISGKKIWKDVDGTEIDAPQNATVKLYRADNTVYGFPNYEYYTEVTVGEDGTYKFENLEKYNLSTGKKYSYKIEEVAVDGYTTSTNSRPENSSYSLITENKTNFNFINQKKQDYITISGKKIWKDVGGNIIDAPQNVTVAIELYRDKESEPYRTTTVGADGTYKFENLEKYNLSTGKEYNYKIREVPVDGYTTLTNSGSKNNVYSITASNKTDLNFINQKKQEYITISGTKTWIAPAGDLPEATIKLYRDGVDTKITTTVGADGTYKFENLEKYDSTDGHEYVYTVDEIPIEKYNKTKNGYNFTNTIEQEYIEISGTKAWKCSDGSDLEIAPPKAYVELYRDGSYIASIEIDSNNTYKFTQLPKYKVDNNGKYVLDKDGRVHVYKYSVKEVNVEGYNITPASGYNNIISTNTNCNFTNTAKKISLSGKVWLDGQTGLKNISSPNNMYDDGETKIPGIPVTLKKKDGTVVRTTETLEDGSYNFTEVNGGKEYYIEFEYNGVKYIPVTPNVGNDTIDSDAKENENNRTALNNSFATIKKGEAISTTGESTPMEYVYTENTAKLKEDSPKSKIIATTAECETYYTTTTSNIDLGLLERGVDLAAITDLIEAKASINGKEKVFKGATLKNITGDYKWKLEEKANYNIYLHLSDYNYRMEDYEGVEHGYLSAEETENAQAKPLEVKLKYAIILNNESIAQASINNIAYYYDSSIMDNPIITNEEGVPIDTTSSDDTTIDGKNYSKIIINTNAMLDAKNNQEILYITFTLKPDELADEDDILEAYNNKTWVEINSYSTEEGLIDVDSEPGNIKDYKEDDSDDANIVNIKTVENKIKISGYVFEDLKTNGQNGDGKFDSTKESKVNDVIVQLIEIKTKADGTRLEYIWQETVAGSNIVKYLKLDGTKMSTYGFTEEADKNKEGEYKFTQHIISGDYIVRFIYGDGTYYDTAIDGGTSDKANIIKYNGQDYKSTIDPYYNEKNYDASKYASKYGSNASNASKARDNEARRIDEMANALKGLPNINTDPTDFLDKTWMCAETSLIGIPMAEDESTKFEEKTINFGLIRRPDVSLKLEKHVTSLKVEDAINITAEKDFTKYFVDPNDVLEPNKVFIHNTSSKSRNVLCTGTNKWDNNNTIGRWTIDVDEPDNLIGKRMNLTYTYNITGSEEKEYIGDKLYNSIYDESGNRYDNSKIAENYRQEVNRVDPEEPGLDQLMKDDRYYIENMIGDYISKEYYTGIKGPNDKEISNSTSVKIEDYLSTQHGLEIVGNTFQENEKEKKGIIKNDNSEGEEWVRVIKTAGNYTAGQTVDLELQNNSLDRTATGFVFRSYAARLIPTENVSPTGISLGDLKHVQTYCNLSKTTEVVPEAHQFIAETIVITKSTGGTDKTTQIIKIAITALATTTILAIGIFIIKKRVIK